MSKSKRVEYWGMYTEEGNRFVQQSIVPHMVDRANGGWFVLWDKATSEYRVDYNGIESYVDGYVFGFADATEQSRFHQQHSEVGDTVVRRCIKTAMCCESEKYVKSENKELRNPNSIK